MTTLYKTNEVGEIDFTNPQKLESVLQNKLNNNPELAKELVLSLVLCLISNPVIPTYELLRDIEYVLNKDEEHGSYTILE